MQYQQQYQGSYDPAVSAVATAASSQSAWTEAPATAVGVSYADPSAQPAGSYDSSANDSGARTAAVAVGSPSSANFAQSGPDHSMPPEISISEAGGGMLFDMVIAFHHVACPVFLRIMTVARASPD